MGLQFGGVGVGSRVRFRIRVTDKRSAMVDPKIFM